MTNMIAHGLCDIGNWRETNEDSLVIDDELQFYVVCDGMGGHAAGEVASEAAARLTCDALRAQRSAIQSTRSRPGGHFQILELVEGIVQDVCRRLFAMASDEPKYAGMGTTFTMLLIVDDKAIMVHVGDSRLYILRQGELHQLSNDHTLAGELVRRGAIKPEEAADSEYAHMLTRSLGAHQGVETETLMFDVLPGDSCLLCTDGLSNYFQDDSEICEYLQRDELESIPRQLIELAKLRGGKDNITAIVARIVAVDADTTADVNRTEDLQRRIKRLEDIDIFTDLSYRRLARILASSLVKTYGRNATIITQRDDCEGLYILLDGSCSVTSDGRCAGELISGDYFGATALCWPRAAVGTVTAKEPSRIMLIRREEFRKLTRRMPKLGFEVMNRLARHFGRRLDEAAPFV